MPRFTALAPMLKVSDLQQTIDFYIQTLNFTLDACWPTENPTWCSLKHDGIHLMFFTGDDDLPVVPSMTGQIYIFTDDVMSVYDKLKNKVEILWGPEVYYYGMHEFGARDINGYVLQFGQCTRADPTLGREA